MNWKILYRPQIPYEELEVLQQNCWDEVKNTPGLGVLLASEPSPTFTAGKSSKIDDLLWDDAALKRHGVQVRSVSRGGKWTYHGPGQLVLYPIVRLSDLGYGTRGVAAFVARLREISAQTIAEYGVTAQPKDCPYGLFVQEKKLVSFGIAIKEGITQHGLALYLRNQSRYFSGIRACGMEASSNISLEEVGCRVEWRSISRRLVDNLIASLKKESAHGSQKKRLTESPLPPASHFDCESNRLHP